MILQLAALLLAPALASEPPMPELELRYKRGEPPTWQLEPPPGEHVAEDTDCWMELSENGGPPRLYTLPAEHLEDGLPMLYPYEGGLELLGTISISLCTDDGSQCRPVHMAIDVELSKRKGTLRWTPEPAEPPSYVESPAPVLAFDEALTLAAEDGKPLLLDFSAQWCPPCQTLAAEVLHAPAHEPTLSALHLVVLDADDPASWEAKARYAVGGYPTVIVTDPEGYELARLVGYPGLDPFLAWLQEATGRDDSLGARLKALRRGDLTHAEAAVLALDLVRADREAQAWEALERSDDSEPALRAILALESHPDALEWLVEHRMDDARSWIWDGLDAMQADPELAAALKPLLVEACRGAEPATVAEVMTVLAELAPEAEAPALYAAAAESMAATLVDDPAHNRGHWPELAWLLEQAGQLEDALAVLDTAIGHYPEEFGYHNSRARILEGLDRWDEAEAEVRLALDYAYGDQRLRAVTHLGAILLELGRPGDGIEAIDAVIADFPVPEKGLDVRTHRYLGQVEGMREDLAAADQGQGG